MRISFGIYGAPRRAQHRSRERIGNGAGKHWKDAHFGFEQLRVSRMQALTDVVFAIASRRADIGGGNGGHDFLGHAGNVIAAKVHISVP